MKEESADVFLDTASAAAHRGRRSLGKADVKALTSGWNGGV